MIGGEQRIGLMAEIGLELARRIFRARRADRNVLIRRGARERGQERAIAVEIVHAIDRIVALALAAARIERRQRSAAFAAFAVDQIEFELERADRPKLQLGKPRDARVPAPRAARRDARRPCRRAGSSASARASDLRPTPAQSCPGSATPCRPDRRRRCHGRTD